MAAAFLVAAGLLLLAPSPAAAQLGRKSWEFFPHVGVFVPSSPDAFEGVQGFQDFDPGLLWGFYATYHYTDWVGVEMGFSKATANHPDALLVPPAGSGLEPVGVGDVSFDLWELSGFVNSGALNRLQVFASGGAGLVNYDPENAEGLTRLLLQGGAGVRYYAWKNIALRGEVRDYFFVDAAFSDYTGRPVAGSEGEGPVGPKDDVHNFAAFAGLTFNF
jgi:hypothetical protein